MTCREIAEEYKKLFILNLEIAGETENIDSYSHAAKILEDPKNKKLLEQVIEEEAPLEIYIGMCIMCVLRDLYTMEVLYTFSDEKLNECFHAVYDIYLDKPTRRFVSKRGIPKLSDFDELFVKIARVKRDTEDNNEN